MTRSLIVLAVALALVGLLVLVSFLSVPHVRSTTSQAWRPLPAALFCRWMLRTGDTGRESCLPASAFSRWPAPVDAGQCPTEGKALTRSCGGDAVRVRVPALSGKPSILPSRPHPTGGTIPDYLGFRGLAGTSTWYAYRSWRRAGIATANPRLTMPKLAVGGTIPDYVAEKGVAGIATFYAYHPGQAAAAARLRDALGDWRGKIVETCRSNDPTRCVWVKLTDYESSLIPGRLIDLSSADFLTLCGPLSRGICEVEVLR